MTAMYCLVTLLLFGQVADSSFRYVTQDGNPVTEVTHIRIKDEANIPATEAGVLIELAVKEGDRVKKDEVMARIDDRQALAAVKVATYKERAARKVVEQDIEIRYAQAASAVAKAEYEKVREANRIKEKAVSESEVERAKLDHKRAMLQIEKAANDRVLASYDAQTKKAEREAAEMALEWRNIRAPFDGEVVQTTVHQSEWVSPGDPILRLVRFDTLYVEGIVRAEHFDREEITGKPVTVEVSKARGRRVSVSGKVVYVDQMLQGKGRYTVRAEVKNELVNDSWLLQPGGSARMTIHLNQLSRASGVERQ